MLVEIFQSGQSTAVTVQTFVACSRAARVGSAPLKCSEQGPLSQNRGRILALPDFVWVKLEVSAREVDPRLEVLRVLEPPCYLFHPLDRGVDHFQAGVRDAIWEVGKDVRQVAGIWGPVLP